VDNIKIYLRDIGRGGVDWIDLTQDRDQWRALVNTVMKLLGSANCWEVLEYLDVWNLLKRDSDSWS
jgi:phenylalanine-4-hydroxylase